MIHKANCSKYSSYRTTQVHSSDILGPLCPQMEGEWDSKNVQ